MCRAAFSKAHNVSITLPNTMSDRWLELLDESTLEHILYKYEAVFPPRMISFVQFDDSLCTSEMATMVCEIHGRIQQWR
jgi:hypothetical protein